jgi:hypothetical protein
MRTRRLLLSVIAGVVASWVLGDIARAQAPGPQPEPQPKCAIPSGQADLVIRIVRHIVPIGAAIREEMAEVSAGGSCAKDVECARVDREKLEKLVAVLRDLGPLRVRAEHTSPHYGFRSITARWAGGSCSFSDGSTGPLDERDSPRFYAALSAVVEAVLAGRPAQKARPASKKQGSAGVTSRGPRASSQDPR